VFTNGIWIGLGIAFAVVVVIPVLCFLVYIVFGSIAAMFRAIPEDIADISAMFRAKGRDYIEAQAAHRKALGYDTPEQEAEARQFVAEAAARERARIERSIEQGSPQRRRIVTRK